jgi:hypothetical protein
VLGRAPSNGFPLDLTDTAGNTLFFVDGSGNVYYHGSLNTFARTTSGRQVSAFAAQTSAPTVEDVGSAQLINGEATVTLDPAFAASIDAVRPYHVFITPNGDRHGLYVATKSPHSFVVRETQSGRSSIAFGYRIVANAVGLSGKRMAFVSANAAAAPRAPLTPFRLRK